MKHATQHDVELRRRPGPIDLGDRDDAANGVELGELLVDCLEPLVSRGAVNEPLDIALDEAVTPSCQLDSCVIVRLRGEDSVRCAEPPDLSPNPRLDGAFADAVRAGMARIAGADATEVARPALVLPCQGMAVVRATQKLRELE
jgi:hypothetical protein